MRASGERLLGKLYRGFASSSPVRAIIGRTVSGERLSAGYSFSASFDPAPVGTARLWFHAASVGELESLWPVIRAWAEASGEVVVTIFSESAKSSLGRLQGELAKIGDGRRLIHAGYSPLEGAWQDAVSAFAPAAFVTAKYESWPDLWAALAERGTPLFIIGARPRASLRIAALVSRLLQGRVPELRFFCNDAADRRALEAAFPSARVLPGGDPRWERVRDRATVGSARARGIVDRLEALPRPWGVLGSAWPSDLAIWADSLRRNSILPNPVPGTLWVVPHKIDAASIQEITSTVENAGRSVLRTSTLTVAMRESDSAHEGDDPPRDENTPGGDSVILVDEMGFLLELYGSADWAYVGGGFEAGVHSTIEPAIQGIPISAGPKRADRFPEIAELRRDGQLTLVKDSDELRSWLATLAKVEAGAAARWKKSAEPRFGATQEIIRAIENDLRDSHR